MKRIFQNSMKLIILTLFIAFTNTMFAQNATGKQFVDIKTSAQCGTCKKTIETALYQLEGVKTATLDVETKIVSVKYDAEKTSVDAIKTAITSIGYDADDLPANPEAYENLHFCCKKEAN